MTASIRNSLVSLAIICPIYIAIIGSCCSDQCSDPNPCTSECYPKPAGGCPSPSQSPYNVANGTECQSGSTWGQCTDGVCADNECTSNGDPDLHDLQACDYPRNGGTQGVCIEERCITAGEDDECVKLNFGRVNCCKPAGCAGADGVLCPETEREADGTTCDPSGVLPVGQGTGTCQQGYCTVGQCNGDCAIAEKCATKSCAPSNGQCGTEQSTGTGLPCSIAIGQPIGSGVCSSGVCGNAGPCSFDCDDGNPCTEDICSLSKLINDQCPNKVCCEYEPLPASSTCTVGGADGVCDGAGNCVQVVCQ